MGKKNDRFIRSLWDLALAENAHSFGKEPRVEHIQEPLAQELWETAGFATVNPLGPKPIFGPKGEDELTIQPDALFIIRTDWSRVLGLSDASNATEDVRLPAPLSFFELQINGVRFVVGLTATSEDLLLGEAVFYQFMRIQPRHVKALYSSRYIALPEVNYFLASPPRWVISKMDKASEAASCEIESLRLVYAQVRATCIMLEAEVAAPTLTVMDPRVKRAREKIGARCLPDHYVVDLAHRHRRVETAEAKPYQGIIRLHFRRAHWANHATAGRVYRKWTLVGNPDLGWVDHIYKA